MAVQQTTLDSHALVQIVVGNTNYRKETMFNLTDDEFLAECAWFDTMLAEEERETTE